LFAQYNSARASHLAWHETLELHELVAYQSNQLTALKMFAPDVKNAKLHLLYQEAIACIENNLKELLGFYPQAPSGSRASSGSDMTPFYAGFLLAFAKTAVRNYGIAITETATPQVRATLQKQLNQAIELHAKAYAFMHENGLYPSYDLNLLLANDVKIAQQAIKN
jgi:spore coat protein F